MARVFDLGAVAERGGDASWGCGQPDGRQGDGAHPPGDRWPVFGIDECARCHGRTGTIDWFTGGAFLTEQELTEVIGW